MFVSSCFVLLKYFVTENILSLLQISLVLTISKMLIEQLQLGCVHTRRYNLDQINLD